MYEMCEMCGGRAFIAACGRSCGSIACHNVAHPFAANHHNTRMTHWRVAHYTPVHVCVCARARVCMRVYACVCGWSVRACVTDRVYLEQQASQAARVAPASAAGPRHPPHRHALVRQQPL